MPTGNDHPESGPRPPRSLKLAPKEGEVVPGRPRLRRPPDENPSEDDIQRFGDVTRICPECNKEVFDDAAVCYHCGYAFERTTPGSSRAPKWIIFTILVVIAAFIIATLWGVF
jgi:hypothetical protein